MRYSNAIGFDLNLPADQQSIDDIKITKMEYQITISTEFQSVEDLAKYLADVITEIENKKHPISGFKGLDEVGDVISGDGWDIEAIN